MQFTGGPAVVLGLANFTGEPKEAHRAVETKNGSSPLRGQTNAPDQIAESWVGAKWVESRPIFQ